MKVVVNDANIIFTLLDCGLMDAFLQLDLQVWTSDFVIAEIEDTAQRSAIAEIEDTAQRSAIEKCVTNKTISVYSYSSDEIEEIFLLESARSLSPADCSVYLLSKIKNAVLLSSDKALRNFATKNGIEVKGIIWILDKLVEDHLLKPHDAAERLEYISKSSMWLPKDEVTRITNKWRMMPHTSA